MAEVPWDMDEERYVPTWEARQVKALEKICSAVEQVEIHLRTIVDVRSDPKRAVTEAKRAAAFDAILAHLGIVQHRG